ncbi:hypothetical protein GOV07_00540 [Candidatus Woesearchaeota archaeon]|nr:hypothetical protein [Candidatus Woesearchaeota archaeon]
MYSSQLPVRQSVIPVHDERSLLKCQMLLEHGWLHFSKKEGVHRYERGFSYIIK